MDDDELYGWGAGGIFGKMVVDVADVDEEMNASPPEIGREFGAFHRVGAEAAVRRRRDQKTRRDSMLVVERFLDELPDLRDRLVERFGPDSLRTKLVNRMYPPFMMDPFTSYPTTVRAALAKKIREASVNTVAEIFSRAYQSEIRRAQAASRLGAFSANDWALGKAQDILATPAAVATSVTTRLERLAARAKHVAKATIEPLSEQIPVVHPEPADEPDEP